MRRIPAVIEVGDPFSQFVEEVRVNGTRIENVFYVNTRKGIVRALRWPVETHKYGKRILTNTFRGKVEVIVRE